MFGFRKNVVIQKKCWESDKMSGVGQNVGSRTKCWSQTKCRESDKM